MNDDLELLDLTSIDQRHEPDVAFRAALHRRVAAIVEPRGAPTLPPKHRSRVLAGLFDSTSQVRDRDAETQPRIIVLATSAAAVAAAVSLVIIRDDPTAPAEAPSPGVTVAATPPTSPLSTVAALPPSSDPYGADTTLTVGNLEPATYAYLDVDRQGFNASFTVPAGWTWNGRYLSKGDINQPDGAAIFFYGGPLEVYSDPCHWSGSESNPSTYFDVVDHLSAQPRRNATKAFARPAAVPAGPVARWPGMVIELTVPDDIDFADCDAGQFRSWGPEASVRAHQGPGQRDLVWAIKIDGTGVTDNQGSVVLSPPDGGLVIDAASFAGTPADVMAEIEAILASIAVGHWG